MIHPFHSQNRAFAWWVFMSGVWASQGFALNPDKRISQYMIQSWTTSEGLPQSTVYSGIQTQDGFIWVGTQEGLARFDGKSFEVFSRKNVSAFKNNNVNVLFEDETGVLLIGTQQGLVVRKDHQFHQVAGPNGNSENIWCIDGTLPEGLWVGTEKKGIQIFENMRLRPGPPSWELEKETIYSLRKLSPASAWIGGAKGLGLLEKGMVRWFGEEDGFIYGAVYWLELTRKGDLWLGTDEGLVSFSHSNFTLFGKEQGLVSPVVYSIYEDQNENLWVGTDTGLARFRNQVFENEVPNQERLYNPINTFWEDTEGNLWVGRSNDGVYCFSDPNFSTFAKEEGLVHDMARAILEDSEGRIIIGTDNGISVFDDNRLQTLSIPGLNPKVIVGALVADPQNGFWVGDEEGGLTHVVNSKAIRYELRNEESSRNWIRALSFDAENRLWVGSKQGIFVLQNGTFTRPDGPLALEKNSAIFTDPSGTVWVSTATRAGYYQKGALSAFRELSLPKTAEVLSFHVDGRGSVWMGTYGAGVWRFDGASVTTITRQQGLFDNTVFSILEDNGYFWMSSNRGVFKVPLESLVAVASGRATSLSSDDFGMMDGMKSSECNGATSPAAIKTKEGGFWYVTTRGVVFVNPRETGRAAPVPDVHLFDIQAGSSRFGHDEKVRFPTGPKQLSVRYTAPNFTQTEKIQFRYRLRGFMDAWQYVKDQRVAYFNHLPPGSYHFEVSATHGTQPWLQAPKSIEIQVTNPFWWITWLKSSLVALALVLAASFLIWRFRQIHQNATLVSGLVEDAKTQVMRLEGAWEIMEKEYLTTIVNAGLGDMAGKVLQNVNQGLGDIQHQILGLEEIVRGNRVERHLKSLLAGLRPLSATRPSEKLSAEVAKQSLTELQLFVGQFKMVRKDMLERVVNARDQIHTIGEMVEVQQDYAIMEAEVSRANIGSVMADALRLLGPQLRKSNLHVKRDWEDLPAVSVHVLKCFLTFCGVIRHVVEASGNPNSSTRECLIQIKRREQSKVQVIVWGPQGENLSPMPISDSKMTFLQEVHWLLGKNSEGELSLVEESNRVGYQILIHTQEKDWDTWGDLGEDASPAVS